MPRCAGRSCWDSDAAAADVNYAFRMAEAEVFYCPVCGGPARADALQCEFCAVHLATQRCDHCLKANFYSARHCSGCGRGLSPALSARSELACPGCQVPLQTLQHPKGVVFECLQCAGQFLEHALLRSLIEDSERLALVLPTRFQARNPHSNASCTGIVHTVAR